MDENMTLELALQLVNDMRESVNVEAIQFLREHWEDALPLLLKELTEPDLPESETVFMHNPTLCTGTLLVGELKEERAFDSLLRAVCEEPDVMFQDLLVSQLGAVLARCSGGRKEHFIEVFKGAQFSRHAKMVAFWALAHLQIEGAWSLEAFVAWLTDELEQIERGEDSEVNDYFICQALFFVPEVATRVGKAFYGDDRERGMGYLFDQMYNASPAVIQQEKERLFSVLGTADDELRDILDDYDDWDRDENELEYLIKNPDQLLAVLPAAEEGRTEVIPTPDDIGRNDLCPCDSGKKFKKCCMNKAFITVPEVHLDWAGKPILLENMVLNHYMEAGYRHLEVDSHLEALTSWFFFAVALEERCLSNIACPADVERKGVFCGFESVESWMYQFLKLLTAELMIDGRVAMYAQRSVLWVNRQFTKASQELRELMVFARGLVYSYRTDKQKEAIEDFRKLLEWRPDHSFAIMMLASMYESKKSPEGVAAARKVLTEGIDRVAEEAGRELLQQQLTGLEQ